MSESNVSTDDLHHPTKTMSVSDEVVIEIKSMHKWYGSFHVLKDINLKVSHGERIVVCGPSGSGKSTAIRCINRLEEHQKGQIIVNVFPAFQFIPAFIDLGKLGFGTYVGAQYTTD